MVSETLENKRKRLIFRSWHRGTREMDLILGAFAQAYVPDMSAGELDQYDELLKDSDPDIYNWITRREDPPQDKLTPVLEQLLASKGVNEYTT